MWGGSSTSSGTPSRATASVVPMTDIDWLICTVAVSCAAADGCDHLDCQGGPFRVVFVATDGHTLHVRASMYSSETGVWSAPATLGTDCECYAQHVKDDIRDNHYRTTFPMSCLAELRLLEMKPPAHFGIVVQSSSTTALRIACP
nr:unnamed protein product [Digitaria exilis]